MDFSTVIHAAQRNEKSGKNEGARYYSTKFAPPKKEQRAKKDLSSNIKKFLAKKEADEKRQLNEAKRKREELLALRAMDKKSTRRVNVMLKRTKSASQSVLEEAVKHNIGTELAQPDEDDYGYVSKEASDFYAKMMEKYSKMPEDPKFDLTKRKVSTNLSSTKERVKSAIEREKEEALHPHKRRKKNKDNNNGSESGTAEKEDEPEESEVSRDRKEEKPKSKPKPPPPALSFHDILKMAEKKQFEPIVIPVKPKEEERLLTKKQRKEFEREQEWRERRDKEKYSGKILESQLLKPLNKPPEVFKKPETPISSSSSSSNSNSMKKPMPIPVKAPIPERREIKKPEPSQKPNGYGKPLDNRIEKDKSKDIMQNGRNITGNKIKSTMDSRLEKDKTRVPHKNGPPSTSAKTLSTKPPPNPPQMTIKKPVTTTPKYLDAFQKSKPESKILKSNDTRRDPIPKMLKKKPMMISNKRRILDDDDEEDYDSEMDDFIDDGAEDAMDYSKCISEIFGYDKSRYRQIDDDVDDMESSFAQQMREEAISKKIGIMEDLEDMKQEEEDKKRKALMKKKMKR